MTAPIPPLRAKHLAGPVKTQFALDLRPAELEAIRRAAEEAGVSTAVFLKNAALAMASARESLFGVAPKVLKPRRTGRPRRGAR